MFRFKQFVVHQDRCAMKVGTDSLILGAWADIAQAPSVLDIGAGTGVLSLMTAQRSPSAKVIALEIDAEAALQARENVEASPWKDRIGVVIEDVRDWQTVDQYAAIISNPPYFSGSTLPADRSRALARHVGGLSPAVFFECAKGLLHQGGSIHLVLPNDQFAIWENAAAARGFGLRRKLMVYPYEGKKANRVCATFGGDGGGAVCDEHLSVREMPSGGYTDAYRKLTFDFHTIFL